jgi:hypothetical protein
MPEKSEGIKPTLWVVIVIVVGFMGFLLGYSVSAFTGIQASKGNVELETGGYGEESEGGGYGAGEPAAGPGQELDEAAKKYYENLIADEPEPDEAEEESGEILY